MTERSSLAGKIAIVTGSTQGLGEAIARLFAERGIAGLIICGRNAERGNAVAAALNSATCRVHFVQADLASVEDCRRIVAAADEQFGKVDILVNAAGVSDRGTIWDTSPELWDWIMAVNVRAPFILIQESIKVMRREGIAGAIVNIGSVSAYGSIPVLTPYATSKGALMTLTRNAAYSVMRHRIRINTLNIGWMDTPAENLIQRKYHEAGDDWLAKAETGMPFGRLLKPKEVARAVAFLASDESGMMTGSIVDFDQSVQGAGAQPIPPAEAGLSRGAKDDKDRTVRGRLHWQDSRRQYRAASAGRIDDDLRCQSGGRGNAGGVARRAGGRQPGGDLGLGGGCRADRLVHQHARRFVERRNRGRQAHLL
jgi:NAD(P)-dependent dehydrogenase (short-subunit alcohol dehydrogenase family)